jgi:putative transposase
MSESDEPTVLHGARIRLYPNKAQAAQFDRWRRGCRRLWNLLVAIERAAYAGSPYAPMIKWRKKWLEVVEANYPRLLAAFEKQRNLEKIELEVAQKGLDSFRARMRETYPRLTCATDEEVDDLFESPDVAMTMAAKVFKEVHRRYRTASKAFEAGQRKTARQSLTPEQRKKILRGTKWTQGPAKLFLWEDELLKVMARLKQEPLCRWIGEIHSHAAQQVCTDLHIALKTMLSERRKRAKGLGGRDTGFPRFKKMSAYAVGSVYFANTQVRFDRDTRRIKFPLGVGEMVHGNMRHIPKDAKLMGGRIFREGEKWWLSAQFRFKAPNPLPKTGKECGLKIAASIIATVVEDTGHSYQVRTPREPARHAFQMNLASKSLSRRKRRTKAYYKQAAKLAYQHARNRNVRDDCLHKTSRQIVNAYDAISVQKMNVKDLMKKDPEQKAGRSLRKINRAAAMARFHGFVTYKAAEGARLQNNTHPLQPIVQECFACGKLHYMPLSKQKMSCECGNVLERRINAAINELNLLQIAKQAAE